MIKRMNDFFGLIKNIFIPAKGHGHLFLLQKTISVCLWLILIFVLCSVFIEIIQIDRIKTVPHWLLFCQNYLVGISCSALVVVISAYIQLKFEQNNAFSEYKSVLFSFLSLVNTELVSPPTTQRERLECINFMSTLHDNYNDTAYRLFWYSPRKNREYRRLISKMVVITSAISNYYMSRAKECLNISVEQFNEVIDIAIAFFNDDFETKLFEYLRVDNS